MEHFKGVSERFRVVRVTSSGISERVVVQVGLDGLNILNSDGNRTLNSYELSHISRWTMRDASLVLFTKTPVDVEERQLTLQGDSHVIRNLLDTLTSCCMQLAELLQSGQSTNKDKEIANSLHQLISTGKSKKTNLPTMESIEFWRDAEKCGWLQSQGEQIKTWRRRWFVMKQGYLFRFKDPDVNSASKPRGVVDLSQVTDVRDGRAATGRPNSICLKTATGQVCYIAESETEQVEWMSALENAVQFIVKHVAGVEDDPPPRDSSSDWVKRLENVFESSSRPPRDVTVSVVNYDGMKNSSKRTSGTGRTSGSGGGSNSNATSDLMLNYGGGYPSLNSSSAPSYPSSAPNYSSNAPNYPSNGPNYSSNTSNYSSSAPSYPSSAPSYNPQPQSAPHHSDPYQSDPYYSSYGGPSGAPASAPAPAADPNYYPSGGSGFSVIDQVPAQQPSYPYFQQNSQSYAAPPTQQPPAALGGNWTMHYSPDGRPYYHNSVTGITQWDIPAGV